MPSAPRASGLGNTLARWCYTPQPKLSSRRLGVCYTYLPCPAFSQTDSTSWPLRSSSARASHELSTRCAYSNSRRYFAFFMRGWPSSRCCRRRGMYGLPSTRVPSVRGPTGASILLPLPTVVGLPGKAKVCLERILPRWGESTFFAIVHNRHSFGASLMISCVPSRCDIDGAQRRFRERRPMLTCEGRRAPRQAFVRGRGGMVLFIGQASGPLCVETFFVVLHTMQRKSISNVDLERIHA